MRFAQPGALDDAVGRGNHAIGADAACVGSGGRWKRSAGLDSYLGRTPFVRRMAGDFDGKSARNKKNVEKSRPALSGAKGTKIKMNKK